MDQNLKDVTVIILAKNEEARIAACLASVAGAGEIIVIDNRSSDKTVAIARKAGADVNEISGTDFSHLRTAGLAKATKEWILYVDADEQITRELRDEIAEVTDSFDPDKDPHGYYIERQNYYLGHKWPVKDKMQRFFYRPSLQGWRGALHETAMIKGGEGTLKHPLLHNTHRSLEEMVAKTNEWSETEAKLRYDAHHPRISWWRLLRVMATGFWRSYIREAGYKAGTVGMIESMYQGFSMFVTYAKLWEMQEEGLTVKGKR